MCLFPALNVQNVCYISSRPLTLLTPLTPLAPLTPLPPLFAPSGPIPKSKEYDLGRAILY